MSDNSASSFFSTDNKLRVMEIERRLRIAFNPVHLSVADESAQHAGHAGALTGKGHFAVTIVAEQFAPMPALSRHRAIYAALGELMNTDIHALRVEVNAP